MYLGERLDITILSQLVWPIMDKIESIVQLTVESTLQARKSAAVRVLCAKLAADLDPHRKFG